MIPQSLKCSVSLLLKLHFGAFFMSGGKCDLSLKSPNKSSWVMFLANWDKHWFFKVDTLDLP